MLQSSRSNRTLPRAQTAWTPAFSSRHLSAEQADFPKHTIDDLAVASARQPTSSSRELCAIQKQNPVPLSTLQLSSRTLLLPLARIAAPASR